jgi:hypothetical protein
MSQLKLSTAIALVIALAPANSYGRVPSPEDPSFAVSDSVAQQRATLRDRLNDARSTLDLPASDPRLAQWQNWSDVWNDWLNWANW